MRLLQIRCSIVIDAYLRVQKQMQMQMRMRMQDSGPPIRLGGVRDSGKEAISIELDRQM